MNQKELLQKAIDKAGSIKKLSEITGITITRFYEWRNGSKMRSDVLFEILEKVGINLKE